MPDLDDEIRESARSIAIVCHLLSGQAEIVAIRPNLAAGLLDASLTAMAQIADDAAKLIRAGAVLGGANVPRQGPATFSKPTDAAETAK